MQAFNNFLYGENHVARFAGLVIPFPAYPQLALWATGMIASFAGLVLFWPYSLSQGFICAVSNSLCCCVHLLMLVCAKIQA